MQCMHIHGFVLNVWGRGKNEMLCPYISCYLCSCFRTEDLRQYLKESDGRFGSKLHACNHLSVMYMIYQKAGRLYGADTSISFNITKLLNHKPFRRNNLYSVSGSIPDNTCSSFSSSVDRQYHKIYTSTHLASYLITLLVYAQR